jgi:Xaa-Pro aminopeptidase
MRLHRLILILLLAATLDLRGACTPDPNAAPLLSWSEQIRVREQWLTKRHAMLLDVMRRHKIDMWIVVNEEFHDDPVAAVVAPPRPLAGNRDIFVFIDTGADGLKKIALAGYAEETTARFFDSPDEPKPPKETLAGLVTKYDPKQIAIGIGGGRGVTRSLTYDTHAFLAESVGAEAAKRFVSAKDLVEELLDTRLPEEREPYRAAVKLTESLVKRALSNEVIKPGVTTVGDVRRWLYDAMWCARVGTWFQPDIRVQRKGLTSNLSRGFLAVAEEKIVIERGDVLHIDFGIMYLGLATDWQKMAYVLREGESEPPAGLIAALRNTNKLQDALMTISRPGKKAGEVYDETMAAMEKVGIEAQVYSHPLGNQGHALGASIDFRAKRRPETMGEGKSLRKGSYIAIELNAKTAVPEWDGQKVFVMEEDPAWLDEDGWKFFVPRQESFYVVR